MEKLGGVKMATTNDTTEYKDAEPYSGDKDGWDGRSVNEDKTGKNSWGNYYKDKNWTK